MASQYKCRPGSCTMITRKRSMLMKSILDSSQLTCVKDQKTLLGPQLRFFVRPALPNTFRFNYERLKNDRVCCSLEDAKMESYKDFLPEYLSAKLPKELEQLYRIGSLVDSYLYKLPRRLRMDNFENIKRYVLSNRIAEFGLNKLKKISYLIPTHYQFYQDPEDNLVVGIGPYGPRNRRNRRKQILRKHLYDFFIRQSTGSRRSHERSAAQSIGKFSLSQNKSEFSKKLRSIPHLSVSKKITRYYFPPKKLRIKSIGFTSEDRLSYNSKLFLDSLAAQVRDQEQKLVKLYDSSLQGNKRDTDCNLLLEIMRVVRNYYQNRNITNTYKATLLTYLIQKTTILTLDAIKGFQFLLQACQSIAEVIQSNTSMQQRAIIRFQQVLFQKDYEKISRKTEECRSTRKNRK